MMSSLPADSIPPSAHPSLPASSSTLGPMGMPAPSLACNPSSPGSTWQGLIRKTTRAWQWKRFLGEPLNSLSPVGQKSGCTEVLAVGVAGAAGEGQGALGPCPSRFLWFGAAFWDLQTCWYMKRLPDARFAARPGLTGLIENDKTHQQK